MAPFGVPDGKALNDPLQTPRSAREQAPEVFSSDYLGPFLARRSGRS